MGKQDELPLHTELIQDGKKLNKRKHHLQERLQKARESKERAEERLQRMQARMQNRASRVQRLEEQLRETYQQLQGTRTDPHTIVLDITYTDSTDTGLVLNGQASQEYSDKAIETQVFEDASVMPASEEVTMTTDIMQSGNLTTLSDAIVQAQDARYAADLAKEAVCRALARVQAATCRLDQYGVARHLDQELTQMQQEIEQVSQVAQEKEQAATQAEQLIRPFVLVPVDEESESD